MWGANSKPKEPELSVPSGVTSHPTWQRLESQISWYDQKSLCAQKYYKTLKIAQIAFALLIPVSTHFDPSFSKWIAIIFGTLIALLESIQHLNQYSTLWVTYRSTTEFLKHEKFLFLGTAGPYKELGDDQRLALLAERVEERVSTEHANWFNETRRQQKLLDKSANE